jgi:release factor glutamine methyltransferase
MTSVSDQNLQWLLRDKYHVTAVTDVGMQREFEKDMKRLGAGEPIAYVVGWVNFLDCRIDLRHKPLIPRPETEYWVEKLLKDRTILATIKQKQKEGREVKILDLCSGSGCIGIAVLAKWPGVHVDFLDVSHDALAQTKFNLELNKLPAKQWRIIHSNLFAELDDDCYDLILTNPPYVDPHGEFSGDLRWEPSQALFAQNGGLRLIKEIIFNSKKYLEEGGKLFIEFGKGQAEAIEVMLTEANWKTWKFHKDQYEEVRWVELTN